MITSRQATNTEFSAFTVILVFQLLKSRLLFTKIAD